MGVGNGVGGWLGRWIVELCFCAFSSERRGSEMLKWVCADGNGVTVRGVQLVEPIEYHEGGLCG